MSAVDDMIAALIKREAGYSNNPADTGGPTRFGITQQVARAHGYSGDMRMLPQEKAAGIYRQQYWIDTKFYDVSLRYPSLAAKLFDTGVNMGAQTAARFLQRALNGLNRAATEYPDMKEDGSIGAMTLAALDTYKTRRGGDGETVLMNAVTGQQIVRYIEICERNPRDEEFLYGWLANRVALV